MFDLFNREALRAKSTELVVARSRIDELKAEVNALTAKLRGDRVCDGYCYLCKHGIEGIGYSRLGNYPKWTCALDCKCKDFEKKEC